MVLTRSQAKQQALNRPPSIEDFQGRGSDVPTERGERVETINADAITPIAGARRKGVHQQKATNPKKILFSWMPDTLPRRLRRNTVGGREGEKIFPSRTRASTSSSDRAESIEKTKEVDDMQQPTPKFGKEMMNVPMSNQLRRTPPPSPKLTPQLRRRSPSPAISEEIIRPLSSEGKETHVVTPTEINGTERATSEHTQEVVTEGALWYDRGGMLRQYIPISNRIGQIGQPMVSKEELQRQEWLRWISWVWDARRQGVESQLWAIIRNCKANLEPGIRDYDIELSRMIFRAIAAETVKRMPTEEEMTQEIREGFILAMQLKDTNHMPAEVQALHRKDEEDQGPQTTKQGVTRSTTSSREFGLGVMEKGGPTHKVMKSTEQEASAPAPRQSRYFTPEQSENESERGSIQRYKQRLPRDIPIDSDMEQGKGTPKQTEKRESKSEVTPEMLAKLTKQTLEEVNNRQQRERKVQPIKKRGGDPSPSPSSSSTSADERRRRARKEKEKSKEKEKKKKLKKRGMRKSDKDEEPSDDPDKSSSSSSDSEVGNKRSEKGKLESSSEESETDNKATKQQRKDFMAILKANAPKKYWGDRDPKILREWVNQVDHYMSIVRLTKRDEMRTILLLLEGDAMLWWRRNRKEFKKKGIASWKAIKRLIVDRFMPLGYRLMLEKQLREVCQRTSAREYASRFTHIIMQLPDYTDKQIISHFINGLKTAVRTQVISHDPTELEEAIRLAENVDDGLFAEQVAYRKTTSVPDPRVTRVTSYKVNQIEGNKRLTPSTGERKFPSTIKCYNCGKLGHISRNCRAPRRPQQQATINESQKIQQVKSKPEESLNDWTAEDRSISNLGSEEIGMANGVKEKIIPPKAGNLIVIYGHIGGKRAKMLLDSGATASFVSEAFVKLHRLRTTTRAHPLRIFFADGRDEISLRLLSNIPVIIGDYQENMTFEVANIKYDCILGKNWHDSHNAVTRNPQDIVQIEHKDRSFTFHSVNADRGTGERVVSTLEDISSRTMSKEVKRGKQEVYAVTVQERTESTEKQATPIDCVQALEKAMEGFEVIFRESIPQEKRNTSNKVEHSIEIEPGSIPPVLPIYRMTQNELSVLKKRLEELVEKGHIRPSSSPYAASALFVPKKSGELRMCVDYRMLNKQTIKNKYPLPLIDELLDKLRGATYFSKLDLSDGYYPIPVKEEDRAKTAFRTLYGHYEFTVMPFGLVNAPATFQRMMNDVLRDFTSDFVVVYLDDIMIYSKDKGQHVQHLRKVFQKLKEHNLYIKPSKSSYFQKQAEYLGYIVRDAKVTPSPEKVQAIRDWPVPLPSVTAVKSFLGMAQFYKRFVRNFAMIAKPLTDLTKTTKEFLWTAEAGKAVQELKDELCKLPEMFLPDVRQPFILRTCASNFAIGAVLSQMRENKEVPVAYFSRKLSGDLQGSKPNAEGVSKPTGEVAYPVHEQELLAIHDALQKWRHYLLGNEFTIFTDHHPLKFFMNQKRLSPRQARWAEFLQQFNLSINYTPGKANWVPDALSRRIDYLNDSNVSVVETTINDFSAKVFQNLSNAYHDDEDLLTEVAALSEGEEIEIGRERWKKKNQLIWKWVDKVDDWRVWVPRKEAEKLVTDMHKGTVVACGGADKTLEYIRRMFTWKGITRDVKRVVENCDECARNKSTNSTLKAMLQPLPIPEEKWTHLSMDFITDLPEAITGENAIYVVVDRLTKQAHFIPCNMKMSAKETAKIFVKEIWRLHGLPKAIVSDRDPRFISSFWKSLTDQLKVDRQLSTAYHPESDGQTERTNRTIEQILRYFCTDQQHRWKEHLAQAEFAYNNAKHASTGMSPFFANYGNHPRTEFPNMGTAYNEEANQFTIRLKEIQNRLKRNIAVAQQRQQLYANKSRKEREFKEGDWVYLATAHLNLQMLTRKLAPRFIGPIRIVEKISRTAYRLEIPCYWKVHDVFYVGLLKECKKPPSGEVKLPLLTHEVEEFEVEDILDHRETAKGRKFLVKWKGYPQEENTWQTKADLANAPKIMSRYFKQTGIHDDE